MIKVENLTKIYQSTTKNDIVALDNISFNLPDHGMIFICGKSGSGKSTLLNLLACLDTTTSGNIIVDGNNLNDLDTVTLDEYRSSHIGFIFQDFHLINNLTVEENIKLSLILKDSQTNYDIPNILEQVNLKGYEKRYPKELSGGQKQRVAIARSLIKNPKYIFADEPTGNLDLEISIQILDLLKELSKDRLVLIISHDITNAYKYGDRIIEIDEGKIIKDVEKTNKDLDLIVGNKIYIPTNSQLTDTELELVNQKLSTGDYILSQEDRRFIPSTQNYEDKKLEIKSSKKTNIKNIYNLSKTFRRKNIVPTVFYSAVLAALLVVLLITQIFFTFDNDELTNQQINTESGFALYKRGDSESHLVPLYEQDIKQFYDLGYTDNIYKLYSSNIAAKEAEQSIFDERQNIANNNHLRYDLTKTPFVVAGKGVLECDLEYLNKIYGQDGKLNIIEGSFEDTGKCELIITDYFADCIRYYRSLTYKQIVKKDLIEMDLSHYRVKAIIDTGYKERYKDVIDAALEIIETDDEVVKKEKMKEIFSNDQIFDLEREVNTHLAVAYYIDGDYVSRKKADRDISYITWSINAQFYETKSNLRLGNLHKHAYVCDENLKPGEVMLGKLSYDAIFDQTEFPTPTLPYSITLTDCYVYNNSSVKEKPIDKDLTLVGVKEDDLIGVFLSPEDYYEVYDLSLMNYGLYFDNTESIINIYTDNRQDLNYMTHDTLYNAAYEINRTVMMLSEIFNVVRIFLYFITIILLVNYGQRIIKRKIYEIGVIKALGGKNKDIFIIIIGQVLLMLVFVAVLSIFPVITLDDYLNSILVNSYVNFQHTNILSHVTVIKFKPGLVILTYSIIFVFTLICSSTLLFSLRKIKPINIIKKDKD